MSLLDDVQAFVQEANRVTEIEELQALLTETVHKLGFDYYALVHHVNIYETGGKIVHLFDYPKSWIEMVDRRSYFTDDPVHMACQKSAAPFQWSNMRSIVNLSARQEEILRSAHDAGLGAGFTVPVHVPGEATGSCSFSTRAGRDLPEAALPAAHYVGSFAFEAARRVASRKFGAMKARDAANPPKLTRRQLDCVVLAGRGKSDKDVARVLGISDQTVHQHLEDAKRKYEVTTRTQLVVRALFDSQVAFVDLFK
ncbi:MAG TPA: LuxR family transcriptional regulator [Rhizomicrobium sp.]|jgi:LuxR family quorum-sensing system transcriptional regulator CciR|nr:LuxR family transcriptional regulator [Rhizomicrobium sp.]